MRGVRSFLGHTMFYRSFSKDFSKITHPLCKLLGKEVKFEFYGDFLRVFNCLKELIMSAPIKVALDWSMPFEVMCDVSGVDLRCWAKEEKSFSTQSTMQEIIE